jgi:hypothetical protein
MTSCPACRLSCILCYGQVLRNINQSAASNDAAETKDQSRICLTVAVSTLRYKPLTMGSFCLRSMRTLQMMRTVEWISILELARKNGLEGGTRDVKEIDRRDRDGWPFRVRTLLGRQTVAG